MKTHEIRTLGAVILLASIALSAIFSSTLSLAQTVEVIVGNRDTTSSQGHWYNSNGLNSYSGTSFYSNDVSASFTWYAVLPQPGDYDVYAWWTYRPNRSTSVPYRVMHSAGEIYTFVDQRDPELAGQWNILGTYTFSAGFLPEITVFANRGQANADAVRLVRVDGQGPGQLNEIVVEIPFHHLGDGTGFNDYVVPDTEGIYWETTVSLEKNQLEESSTAYLELFLFNNERNNLLINGRQYALPYTEPVNGLMLPNTGKTIINLPHDLLREGANTIAFQANNYVSPSGLDDFEFGEVILVLSR